MLVTVRLTNPSKKIESPEVSGLFFCLTDHSFAERKIFELTLHHGTSAICIQ